MAGRGKSLIALGAAALLLVGCSTSYHAGDEATRQWDAWVKDNPLAGARVTDAVGTNVQPFQGSFEAYARLTAPANQRNVVKAMASMCRFDDETASDTTYWLQIDRVSLQAPCDGNGQEKVAKFWEAVHELPGIEQVAFSSKGLSVTADDEHLTALVPEISAAADATGHAGRGSSNDYASKLVTITQAKGKNLSTELALAQGVLDTAGDAVLKIEVVAGRVSAATSGSVAQADGWQQDVGVGSPVLTVTPANVTTELAFTTRGRDLIDRLADDSRVHAINVVKAFWEIEVLTTKDARSLILDLKDEPAGTDLGKLQLDIGPSNYKDVDGSGRTCFVRPDFSQPSHAAAMLDLCDLRDVVEVDDRFDAGLDLRQHSTDLKPVLACLKHAPFGLSVYLQTPQGENYEFTTGEKLQLENPAAPATGPLEEIWESLPS